jgi:predicted nuclease with TOPRIM domain
METFKIKLTVVMMGLALLTGMSLLSAYAEEGSNGNGATPERTARRQAKIAEMKQLKQENPEAYQKLVQEKKAKLKERMQNLKENNPEKYEELKDKFQERRKGESGEIQRGDAEPPGKDTGIKGK